MTTDNLKNSNCKGCGALIYWIKTKGGKDMPVNPEKTTIMTMKGEIHKGYIPHWATCPKVDNFRFKHSIKEVVDLDHECQADEVDLMRALKKDKKL